MNIKLKIETLCKEGAIPGATYGILYRGRQYYDCVGARALDPKWEKNTIDTIYDIASLTKVIVTNTLMAKLYEQEKIHWKDLVCKYLPDFPYTDITLYHLLTHTSGLVFSEGKKISCKADVYKRLDSLTPKRKPGTLVEYADHNYILLGFIIEKIYQKEIEKIALEEIFKPLKMTETGYHPISLERCAPTERCPQRGLLRGVVHDEKSYYSEKNLGSAGVFSTVTDLGKFVKMVLQNGVVDGKQFLKKETIDLWFQPSVYDSLGNARGIGWLVGNVKNITGESCSRHTISHTGFTGTSIIIDRDDNLGFIFLSNRIHPTRENNRLLKERDNIVEILYKELEIGKEKTKKLSSLYLSSGKI